MPVDHDVHNAESLKELSFFALKTLVTINAGAIVVLLAFIGNIEDGNTVVFDINRLKCSLLAFTSALTMIFFTVLLSYIATHRSLGDPEHDDGTLERFLVKMVVPPTISFFLFLAGVLFAVTGIQAPI